MERSKPNTTFNHSAPLTAWKLLEYATAAPVRPAISAWLSDVGMPKYHAAVAQMTMDARAPLRAMELAFMSVPKSTMLLMVMATLLLIRVITKTPRKLQTAAIRMAFLGLIARVEMQVAIAFGASVQPLTRITPIVKMTVTNRAGLAKIS